VVKQEPYTLLVGMKIIITRNRPCAEQLSLDFHWRRRVDSRKRATIENL
jgi:hypothetical protein